jgi:hypothetical protein
MATYHVSIKVAKNECPGSSRASAHYAYVGRLGRYEKKFRTDEEVVYVKSGNMPFWAMNDPSIFWLASDTFERKNGSVYRELEAALPRELSHEKHRELIDNFINKVLSTQHPYSLAIHSKKAADGLPQPHVHLMWSERQMDGIERGPSLFFKRAAAARRGNDDCVKSQPDASKGGCKKIPMYPRINYFRALWADLLNAAYKDAELEYRVTHVSLRDQGIDRDPEPYLGPVLMRGEGGKALLELRKAYRKAAEVEAESLELISRLESMRSTRDRLETLFASDFLKRTMNRNIDKVNVCDEMLPDDSYLKLEEDSQTKGMSRSKPLQRNRY